MKKIGLTIILTFILVLFSGCEVYKGTSHQQAEQPHLYWKDIDVIVTDIDKRHWFAGTHWYVVSVTVQSEEYGLSATFQIEGSGAFGCPPQWEYDMGDTVKAQLYSWVLDSTGEVIKRKINQIY